MTQHEYRCTVCGGVFNEGWPQADAEAEAERLWAVKAAATSPTMAIVCDDCYREFMAWAERAGRPRGSAGRGRANHHEEGPPMNNPNCYECQYRGSIPGDAHSRCLHPTLGEQSENEFTAMMNMLGGQLENTNRAARTLGITGHPHGIRSGWFMWPVNFDPTWLLTCNGFCPKIKKSD